MGDNVNSPKHYAAGNIEPIDFMKDRMTDEQFRGFLLGNIIKYTSRFGHKNGVEDLKKAGWYLNRLISEYEN